MIVDEVDTSAWARMLHPTTSFGLTILPTDLLYKSRLPRVFAAGMKNNGNHPQGNYDYDAHARLYWGGADPLGSQGYANAVKKILSAL